MGKNYRNCKYNIFNDKVEELQKTPKDLMRKNV